jgi:hydrogenase expression/formation protein HypC
VSSCDDDHCVTCSDEALPLEVEAVRTDGTAICQGIEVMTELVPDAAPGDTLLVHAGAAIARLE